MTSDLAICHYDPNAELQIKTDASLKGIASILLQKCDNEWRILACMSRSLRDSECNYTITELEGLAVVTVVQKFRPYVYGKPVLIMTDHCALCALMTKFPLPPRLQRWSQILQEYNLQIKTSAARTTRMWIASVGNQQIRLRRPTTGYCTHVI